MNIWLGIRFFLVCILLTSCSLPGFERPINIETPTQEINTVEPTQDINTVTPAQEIKTVVPTATKTVKMPVETVRSTNTVPPQTLEPPLTPTSTPLPDEWYTLQPGTPLATFNIVHAEAGCSWLGVGGQVFSPDGAPLLGVTILVSGTIDGHQFSNVGTTGMETNIGEGGYEITLADHPEDSNGTLWIQVVNKIGAQLSEKIPFNTINDCDRNFILINFNRNQPSLALRKFELLLGIGWRQYLPVILDQAH